MNTSPDGRFKLIRESGSSDHFYHPDGRDRYVIDTHNKKQVASFSDGGEIYKVEFSEDGWEILAKDALLEVIERTDLRRL